MGEIVLHAQILEQLHICNFGWQNAEQNLTCDVDGLDGLIGPAVLKY
jgi:hypothetical protein